VVLEALEKGEREGGGTKTATLIDDLPLFSAAIRPAPAQDKRQSATEALLRETNPDALTPLDALRLVYRLRETLED
jgi:DNA mismatch repair protein MutS